MADKGFKGMDKLIKDLKSLDADLPRKVDLVVGRNAQEMVKKARTNTKANGTFDLGKLNQSIVPVKIEELRHKVSVGVVYAAYVEFGTGTKVNVPAELSQQAAAAKNLPKGSFESGLESIKKWAKRKGIPENAAWPIFMKILRVGLKPKPFLYPALLQQRPIFFDDLKKLLKRELGKL